MPNKTIGLMTHNELRTTIKEEIRSEVPQVVIPMFEKVHSQIHRLAVLYEQMNSKIDLALDVSKRVSFHDQILPEHSMRLDKVETEIKVIKLAITKPKG
jgi:hypothetical protein